MQWGFHSEVYAYKAGGSGALLVLPVDAVPCVGGGESKRKVKRESYLRPRVKVDESFLRFQREWLILSTYPQSESFFLCKAWKVSLGSLSAPSTLDDWLWSWLTMGTGEEAFPIPYPDIHLPIFYNLTIGSQIEYFPMNWICLKMHTKLKKFPVWKKQEMIMKMFERIWEWSWW